LLIVDSFALAPDIGKGEVAGATADLPARRIESDGRSIKHLPPKRARLRHPATLPARTGMLVWQCVTGRAAAPLGKKSRI
jgi:hypothetical protein